MPYTSADSNRPLTLWGLNGGDHRLFRLQPTGGGARLEAQEWTGAVHQTWRLRPLTTGRW
ncbi:hypothetical protein ACIBIZ_12655 [Nonomuraea spiralis]|uniref:hypothetical protein n=1 Tax=Nonomuraea spiralis TaxID=46182 RepID=UPI0037AD4BB6